MKQNKNEIANDKSKYSAEKIDVMETRVLHWVW